jgi:hypothetical protein
VARPAAPQGCRSCGKKFVYGSADRPLIFGELTDDTVPREFIVRRRGLGVAYGSVAVVDGTDVDLLVERGWLEPVT